MPVGRGRRRAVNDTARGFSRLSRATFIGGIVLTATLFAAGAWQRRWIADDGLIVLRTVRNLMAGNGPVFNSGERVETNTSAAWTYVVWFFSWLTQARLEYVVLGIALTMSVLAIVFAMLGAARLWGGTSSALLVPAGAVVYIALPPARDYATSGLENCLVIFWVAILWWWLMRWSQAEKVRVASFFGLVFWAGLAPLIRPELSVLGGLTLLVLFCAPVPATRLRPWLFRILVVAVAGLVPVGYQIWRMGYYGLPYPNTAVAKDAGGAKWSHGFTYLWDLVGPYWLWLPLLLLAAAAIVLVRTSPSSSRRALGRDPEVDSGQEHAGMTVRERIHRFSVWLRTPAAVVTLMVGSGVLLVIYELRVGGDFMHGRMLLPQLFLLILPVAVLPIRLPRAGESGTRRLSWAFAFVLAAFAGTVGWALFAADTTAIKTGTTIRSNGIVDERIYYVLRTGHDHPILASDYLDYPWMRAMVRDIANSTDGALLIVSPSFMNWYIDPAPAIPPGSDEKPEHVVFFLNLGMTSMNVPLDVRVIDQMGLAYPLAAHTDRLTDGRIGHDKSLYPDWVVVDTGMVDKHPWMPSFLDEKWVTQARTALSCPETQALLASSRAPLTFDRWRHNLMQSLDFAKYRIDRVPKYEIQRCQLVDPTQPPPPAPAPPK
ncbi:flagellar motor control protein ZomB [Nocardia concava]|uniref:flagellar motor control protein ZomB n=1 Tax=Nocardia concava TaxID=257281 RepID=UPI002479C621|nr:flagellar motor control protein ZomB [Nocardia concava]